MEPYLETLGVILVALVGIVLGTLSGRLCRSYWLISYLIAVLLLALLVSVRCFYSLNFVPPFCWLVPGRIRFVVLALAVTLGVMTPLRRLRYRFQRVLVCGLMIVVLVWYTILPFLAPALVREKLANLPTSIGSDGLCYQTTDYTCGPAAAVTALRKLGLDAEEGDLAILSHCNPVTGTLPNCLVQALQKRYADAGLRCEYEHLNSVDRLKELTPALAIVKDRFLIDHCVAVLDVTDTEIVLADPATGRERISHRDFENMWRFAVITLSCDTSNRI